MTEFRIQAGALRAAAVMAAAAVGRRSRIPILSHLHLAAADGTLTVRATSLEDHLQAQITGDGMLPPITVSAQRLVALLAGMAPETTAALSIETTDQLRLAAGTLVARLYTLPAEDFPVLDGAEMDDATALTLQAGTLLRLLERPSHAVSTEETRYYLNGIFLHRHGNALCAVATDGHRLFVLEEPYPAEAAKIPAGIVPLRAVRLAVAALRRMPGEAAVTWLQSKRRAALIARSWRLDTKLIDGTYPDYRKVIPDTDGAAPIQVRDAGRLARAVAMVAAISGERSRPIRLANGSGTTLTLSSHAAHDGDCALAVDTEVAAWATDAPHPEFGLQARYLRELCRALPSGFTMRVRDGSSPIHCAGPEGIGVLMPMRI